MAPRRRDQDHRRLLVSIKWRVAGLCHAVTILGLALCLGDVSQAHPQCLDFRPPFNVTREVFCRQYADFGCCSVADHDALASRYAALASELASQGVGGCDDDLKALLCQECSPYAAHIFDSEATLRKRPFPGLCTPYCQDLHSRCPAAIALLIPGDQGDLANVVRSRDEFCRQIALQDLDYCYPDLLTNPALNQEISPESVTSDGCLCLELFADNLRNALIFEVPPDGSRRIFIGEQRGMIHIFGPDGSRYPEPYMDITDMVLSTSSAGDERGFLGMAFHPDYQQNRKFYVYFSMYGSGGHQSRISEFRTSENNPDKVDRDYERIIIDVPQPYSNHNGGELLFALDGYLYVFLGDGGAGGDPLGSGQNRATLLGSVLRLDINHPELPYGIPPDNPFVGLSLSREEIYAYGIRNIWRCDMDEGDPVTGHGRGRIFCGDVGQSRYEEIDIIEKGGNYGWNAREGFECYRSSICGRIGPEILPIHAYDHSVGKSVTGGAVYRGCLNPNLQGYYIFGDYVDGRLFRLKENMQTGQWEHKELRMCGSDVCFNGLVGRYEVNILSFGEDADGEIYILTTNNPSSTSPNGKVYKIVDPRRRGDPSTCRTAPSTPVPTTTSPTTRPRTTRPPTTPTTTRTTTTTTTTRSTTRPTTRPITQPTTRPTTTDRITGEGPVRLRGPRAESGRVEVYHDGRWGTVCENGWGNNDARATCRALGHQLGYAVYHAAYGAGSDVIWIHNVDCRGPETNLLDCNHGDWGQHSCTHAQDAGVDCFDNIPVRLVAGSNTASGRLEVYFAGRWGTVCGRQDSRNAQVVCRQLGMRGGTATTCTSGGSGAIWMSNLECDGGESDLGFCYHRDGLGMNTCDHSRDMCVQCEMDGVTYPSTTPQPQPTAGGNPAGVRLAGGSYPGQGRVEVYHDGQWGTVCQGSWDNREARVVCRQLGWSLGFVTLGATFGAGSGPVWLDNLRCRGQEASLADCSHNGWGVNNCDGHQGDGGVDCFNELPIRLAGGADSNMGRVEIYYNGQWGTVCDNNFGSHDARVVCRMLGYEGPVDVIQCCGEFSPGSGPVYLEHVSCWGDEESLAYCANSGLGRTSCDHGRDVGVRCRR